MARMNKDVFAIATLIIRASLVSLIICVAMLLFSTRVLGQEKKSETRTEANSIYGEGGKKIVTYKEGENGEHIVETKILDPKGVVRWKTEETSTANGRTIIDEYYEADGKLDMKTVNKNDASFKVLFHSVETYRGEEGSLSEGEIVDLQNKTYKKFNSATGMYEDRPYKEWEELEKNREKEGKEREKRLEKKYREEYGLPEPKPAQDDKKNESALEATTTIVGIVLPADTRPGDRVSGTVVTDPKRYEGIPGLTVVEMQAPATMSGAASLSGVVVDTEAKEPQNADSPIVFAVPENAYQVRMMLRSTGSPNFCMRTSIAIVGKSGEANDRFSAPPVVTPGSTQVIRGPLGGDCRQTHVDIGGQPAEVIAESPREAYINVPSDLPAGSNEMTVTDGPHYAKLPVYVLSLAMWADLYTLQRGQSTKFHLTASGPEQLPEEAWKAGFPTELVDLAKLSQIAPGFDPPKPGEKGVVLVLIENMVPLVISIKDSKNERINFTLHREDFAKGPFRYDGTIKSKQAGGFNINGTVIAFLAPATGEEREVPTSDNNPASTDSDREQFHQKAVDRLHELSKQTKDAATQITDPQQKQDLEEFAKYLDDKATEIEETSQPVSDELEDLIFNCQSNEDAELLKKSSDAYKKYLETTDYSIKEKADKVQVEREKLKKKAEDAHIKSGQAHYKKYDPEKKKKADDAYEKWRKAREKKMEAAQKLTEAKQKVQDAKQKAEAEAENPQGSKGTEFGDYEQAKKDLVTAQGEATRIDGEYTEATKEWDKAVEENQKAINPDLQKQEDEADKEEKAANEEFKTKTEEYQKLYDEYQKSGDQKLYKEYEKLRDQYLNPPKVQT